MEFKQYFFGLSPAERKGFAERVSATGDGKPTTVGHLNNCAYGYAPLSVPLCVAIERESGQKVTRREMKPADFSIYWPELERRQSQRKASK